MRKRGSATVSSLTLLVMSVTVVAVFALAAVPAAQASVTYNITLTETYPTGTTYSGTGSFTLAQAPGGGNGSTEDYTFGGANGSTDSYTTGDLLSLSLTIDGSTFNVTSGCNIQFNSKTAVLENVYGCSFPTVNNISVNSFGATSYGLNVPSPVYSAGGNVSIAVVTPEPSTLLLWGTGLLALGAIFRKKPSANRAVSGFGRL